MAGETLLGVALPLPDGLRLAFAPTVPIAPLSFGERPELVLHGLYGAARLPAAGGEQTYTLLWSGGENRSGHDYWSYLQLLSAGGERLAGTDDAPMLRWLYPTTLWSAADRVPVRYRLRVPELPPGAYRLVTGVYPPFGAALPANGDHQPTLAWLKVPQSQRPVPAVEAVPVGAVVNGLFRLAAVEAQRLDAAQVRVRLTWESLAERPAVDATVFVHVLDAADRIVAQSDVRPWNGQYPTFIWSAGETVQTEHTVSAADTALRLRVGMYVFPGPENLPLRLNGADVPGNALVLPAVPVAR